jgi:hypothetical protein
MTAAALIHDLADAGIWLSRNGDKLRVEGKPGAITPELRLTLTEHKTELLAALSDEPSRASGLAEIRHRLRALADAEAINAVLINALPDDELAACAGLPTETLRAYVRALHDDDLRRHGKVPPDETARALCAHCGPVWIHPAVAAAAPVVNSWPRLLGCQWCAITRAGQHVPRPPASCANCRHFTRDALNPDAGMGRCSAGCDPARPFPNATQQCERFQPENK